MIYAAVFILSFSSLAFEILLTRIFSISQWNHLSFMVISIALLGFACSGIFLNILSSLGIKWESRYFTPSSISALLSMYTSSVILSFILLNWMPLDYFMLPVEPAQLVYIVSAFCILAIPFFICGIVFSIAYAGVPEKTGFIYFFSMFGSAIGAITPFILIGWLDESRLTLVTGFVPILIIPFYLSPMKNKQNKHTTGLPTGTSKWKITLILNILCIFLLIWWGITKGLFEITPSHYKALSQLLKFPNTHIDKTSATIRGRLDTVSSKYIRYAPGLSIKYMGLLPNQYATFLDGDTPLIFYDVKEPPALVFTNYTLDKCGYITSPPVESVLVVVKSGGLSIPCALSSGAKDITVIHENPQISEQIKAFYNINVISKNPRSFLEHSRQSFDVIHMDNRGASLPGASALDEEYGFTTDSFKAYLSHLTSNGRLIITRRLILPPSDMLRMAATAYESLKSMGIQIPNLHMAILRNWDTYTLIVSATSFDGEISKIEQFAGEMNFDMVYLPGMGREKANRFNIFGQPYYFDEIKHLFSAYNTRSEEKFFKHCLLNVVPQTDNCPFPYKHLKWQKLPEAYKATGSRSYSLFLSGEILVMVVFIEAVLISMFFLLLPVNIFPADKLNKISTANITYFFFVGAGFMFVEMYFIKAYVLLFGNPVTSFTVTLAGILITSGIGGGLSQKIGARKIKYGVVFLSTVLFMGYFILPGLIHAVVGFSERIQFILAIMILVLPGILMGFPFSLGMRLLAKNSRERAYAWAANGCASVLTAIFSAHVALNWGIEAILIFAIISYLFAYFSITQIRLPYPIVS